MYKRQSLAVMAGVAGYSILSKIKRSLSESLIYKDTPTLLAMYDAEDHDYKQAQAKCCYGEMGRISSKMQKIKDEVALRAANTRMQNKLVQN